MADSPVKILVLGAHPDDAEFAAGGLIVRACRRGHDVRMVSVTNGGAGHHRSGGPPLTARRRAEAAASAARIGARYEVWDFPDGALEPTLDVRAAIIRSIRSFAPDLVLTHRPNDYHPDHRAVGQAVQDASYLVTVPNVVPDAPILRRDPIVAYLPDLFTKPTPLEPHVVLDTTDEFETVVDLLACHESQVFEWLPFNQRIDEGFPVDAAPRRAWLRAWFAERLARRADRFRAALVNSFGAERGNVIQCVEAFEISEYAAPLDTAAKQRLFGEQ